ncbi:MAG TPA: RNA polymerase sigma factor [Planctomycetota bacterium]|nr:RNA polymerase sigma factor [Planctomycetota bacterium]
MRYPTLDHAADPALHGRLLELAARTHDTALERVARGEPPRDGSTMATERERSDWVNTCLMDAFKNTGDAEVFALLFELNRRSFMQAISGRLRHCRSCVDAEDVLQESFLNIYRYPHRFLADRADSFRNWGHRIVRNTLIGFFRGQARQPKPLCLDEEHEPPADPHVLSPERVASDHESVDLVNHAFVLFLELYLRQFSRLSAREQRALTLAEIEGWCYRDIARELCMSVANVKVLIYRSRQRICRGMSDALAELGRSLLAADEAPAAPEAP